MTIINFPGHLWAHCTDPHCACCHLCRGGLSMCTRCGGMEGSLPTDCPGERMTHETGEAVYAGAIDWIHGAGWIEQPSVNSPARYR